MEREKEPEPKRPRVDATEPANSQATSSYVNSSVSPPPDKQTIRPSVLKAFDDFVQKKKAEAKKVEKNVSFDVTHEPSSKALEKTPFPKRRTRSRK